MPVVVMGMHRSGTSLVAQLLHRMGIHMGEDLLEPDAGNPAGYFEDQTFLGINKSILEAAGGDWTDPPEAWKLRASAKAFRDKMLDALGDRREKHGDKFGWKDPRNSLLGWDWAALLTGSDYQDMVDAPDEGNAHFVWVQRDWEAIIRSLVRLHGDGEWWELCERYDGDLARFHEYHNSLTKVIRYEELVDRRWAEQQVAALARFAGVGSLRKVRDAVDCIRYAGEPERGMIWS